MESGNNEIFLGETDFLPSIEFLKSTRNDLNAAVILDDRIDLEELATYIDLVGIIRIRKDYKYKRYIYNAR